MRNIGAATEDVLDLMYHLECNAMPAFSVSSSGNGSYVEACGSLYLGGWHRAMHNAEPKCLKLSNKVVDFEESLFPILLLL